MGSFVVYEFLQRIENKQKCKDLNNKIENLRNRKRKI